MRSGACAHSLPRADAATERTRIYAHNPDFFNDERVYLALAHGRLLCAASSEPNNVFIVSRDTLEIQNKDHPIALPLSAAAKKRAAGDAAASGDDADGGQDESAPSESAPMDAAGDAAGDDDATGESGVAAKTSAKKGKSAPSTLLFSHLTSDTNHLFAVRFNKLTNEVFVDEFDGRTVVVPDDDSAPPYFKLLKSLPLEAAPSEDEDDYLSFVRERLSAGHIVADGDRLEAVTPVPDSTSLITTTHRWEVSDDAWARVFDADADRDKYVVCLDHQNSVLWSYQSLNDMLIATPWWMTRHRRVAPYSTERYGACSYVTHDSLVTHNPALELGAPLAKRCDGLVRVDGDEMALRRTPPIAGGAEAEARFEARDAVQRLRAFGLRAIAEAPGPAPPQACRLLLLAPDALLRRVDRDSATARDALQRGDKCDNCSDALLPPPDAPPIAPPSTDVDERGFAPNGLHRAPRAPSDYYWHDGGEGVASVASKQFCDMCVRNEKPVKHETHEHPLVARCAGDRLHVDYGGGWVCDICKRVRRAHDPDVMHHCAEGCHYDLCDDVSGAQSRARAPFLAHLSPPRSAVLLGRACELRADYRVALRHCGAAGRRWTRAAGRSDASRARV